MKKKIWFTLVEMIVVIVILAVISWIASLSLMKWFWQSRDVKRKSDINILITALENYQYKNDFYPDPDSSININYSWSQISVQWKIWDWVGSKIQLKSTMSDPYDKTQYMYSINQYKSAYQIWVMLEMQDSDQIWMRDVWYAADFSERYPYGAGLPVWSLVLSGTNQPVDEIWSWFDIKTWVWSYYVFFPKKQWISWNWNALISAMASFRPDLIWFDNNVVWYWGFEETYWNIIHSSSSYINTWVASWNPEWTEWLRWSSLLYDWIDDLVSVPDSNSLDVTGAVTLSVWVNPSKTPSLPFTWIAWKVDSSVANTTYWLVYNNDWKVYWYINWTSNAVSAILSPWNWTHLALVYDSSTISLYVNWVLSSTKSYTTAVTNSTYPFKIWSSTNLFSWKIDEVRIYKRALSDSEVQLLYNAR